MNGLQAWHLCDADHGERQGVRRCREATDVVRDQAKDPRMGTAWGS